MRLFSMLAGLVSAAAANAGWSKENVLFGANPRPQFRSATPSAPKKGLIDKSGLPHGYPGAKLARRAVQGALGVKHMGGMRQNGVTCTAKTK